MGNATSAPVSRAPVGVFECQWCFTDIQNESAVVIDGDPICAQCTKENIIPKFHAALKHEIEYPVKWGPVTLKPQHFEEFFDDYLSFIWNWAEKEREYKTPGKDRVYCQEKGCEAYVGDRTAFRFPVAFCHGKWVCSRCGHPDTEHECKVDGQDDGLQGAEGCMRCPRGCAVTLIDGCNLVECKCSVVFCYCCGKEDPEYDHFSRGKPCPKFGVPGAQNAMYAEDVDGEEDNEEDNEINAEQQRQQREQQRQREVDRWATIVLEQVQVLTAGRPNRAAPDAVVGQALLRAVRHAQQNNLQASAGHPDLRNLQREAVIDHLQILRSIEGNGQDIQQGMEEDGLLHGHPQFGERLEDIASKVAENVDLYPPFGRIQAAHAEYTARHAEIMNFIRHEMPETLFDYWPRMYAAFTVYELVAPAMLAAAAPVQ